ncbi:aminotransferase class V-fold PLP-dependent enzyme [Paracoccus sp. Z330]|uniref:Aminotransferase class V-fold PLP-dependent enzyme n=1 Tax=Paracoccus onchidii TaxID=3017813 RepID=A0ABT4ZC06_9RHOB|nr:aminotransferase class V-fold PLP-dependent enzyme [Paracoccus onchidii]MDB6176824.1 aminotransferase class V-fold PLP-dependent enzyme [Paracoccus onchidii]
MSLAAGHALIAIPGPSPVPDRVLRAAHRAAPDIYGEELADLNMRVMDQLKRLAGTTAHLAPYIGNGHTAWEAVAANLVSPGDQILVLTSGFFGRAWAEQVASHGAYVEKLDFGNDPVDPDRLTRRLADDNEQQIRAVLLCHTDTATGSMADIYAIRQAMGDHPALLVVDAIASLGCAPMMMDDWGVDVLISASQKGLMCPPGTSFVWFSDRAATHPSGLRKSPFWDWHIRASAGRESLWQFWGGTAPVQHLFALNEALTMLLDEEGLPAVWARHAALARAVWAAVEAWGAGNPDIRLTIDDPASRAASVTAVRMPHADALRSWVTEQCGVTLGIGLGAQDPANALRIAHMGHTNAGMILGALASMQAGLIALEIPHGSGALHAAASVIAEPA